MSTSTKQNGTATINGRHGAVIDPGPSKADRPPPSDIRAEQGCLGSILHDETGREVFAKVRAIIECAHFYRDAHQTIFHAMEDLYDQGVPINPLTLCGLLEQDGRLDKLGGSLAIGELCEKAGHELHAEHYAKRIRGLAAKRGLADAAIDLLDRVYSGDLPAAEIAKRTLNLVGGITAADDDEPATDVKDPIGRVDPAAFHGVLGRLAWETRTQTEADPLAVLVHLLVFFGASAGRNPHFVFGGTRNRLNLFECIVGMTGGSRKGTAADVAQAIWSMADPDFARENIINGLTSGKGLLIDIRDPSVGKDGHGRPVVDGGIDDKRRVYLEEEMGSVLKSGHRDSENLLELLRKFWDARECIRTQTKDPTRVTGGHVALMGHCTPEDLKFHLSDRDRANGTANRMEYLFCRRSRCLPEGGNVFDLLRDFLAGDLQQLREALEFARKVEEIRRTAAAAKMWEPLYRSWSQSPPGRIGHFFQRRAAIVMRRAAIFAVADLSPIVDECHLRASLAIWEHAVRTLRFIFPEDVDPVAEKLLKALDAKPGGLTRREIIAAFNNHMKAKELNKLLERLMVSDLIEASEPASRGGRPAARYARKRW